MFIDLDAQGGRGEPHFHTCRSCDLLIEPGHPVEEIAFETNQHDLMKLNGIYHAECASPLLAVKRAYDTLLRFGGGM